MHNLKRGGMPDKRQQFGAEAESYAIQQMRRLGYKILERNYRTKLGEIDIIAKHKDTIVFAEVKARSSALFGGPKWAVTPKKQRKISMVALQYLKSTNRMDEKARFDVVAIRIKLGIPQIEIIQNAFELAYT